MPPFRVLQETISVRSKDHVEIVDLTNPIRDVVWRARVDEGVLLVNALHTTCAIFVNEYQCALIDDVKAMLCNLIADHGGFRHDDPRYSDCERGNASAHLRTALLGRSVALGIAAREVALGRFQSILLVELDGPRTRDIDIRILG
jgi:secondary thiamine-phosphate synthase enzyme